MSDHHRSHPNHHTPYNNEEPPLPARLHHRELNVVVSKGITTDSDMPEGSSTSATTTTTATTNTDTDIAFIAEVPVSKSSSSSLSSFRTSTHTEPTVLYRGNSNSKLQLPRSTSTSHNSGDRGGRYSFRRNCTGPSTQSIQLVNSSRRYINTTNSTSMRSNNMNSYCDSNGSSNNLLFSLHDSMASFVASPAPTLISNPTTFPQIDEDFCGNSDNHDQSHDSNTNRSNNSKGHSQHVSRNNSMTRSSHRVSRRPSVFTTLSGSRYYMDETKGEPIPVPASITHHGRGAGPNNNASAVRRMSSQLSIMSNLSNGSHPYHPQPHPHTIREELYNSTDNGPPAQHLSYPNNSEQSLQMPRRHSMIQQYPQPPPMSHLLQPLSSSSHHHRSQGQNPQSRPFVYPNPPPQFQNPTTQWRNRSQPPPLNQFTPNIFPDTTSLRSDSPSSGTRLISKPLKSIQMLVRIPPPVPPLPPYKSGIEMNCEKEIYSAPIGQRSCPQYQSRNDDKKQQEHQSSPVHSAFVVGVSIHLPNGDSIDEIPNQSYVIKCPKCQESMIVSKFCQVFQCPECHEISPCELTTLNIINPRQLQTIIQL